VSVLEVRWAAVIPMVFLELGSINTACFTLFVHIFDALQYIGNRYIIKIPVVEELLKVSPADWGGGILVYLVVPIASVVICFDI
jgi:hypothetical protein